VRNRATAEIGGRFSGQTCFFPPISLTMKIVVTGAAGRLGRAAVNELMESGHEVLGLDVASVDAGSAVICHPVDLLDAESTAAHVQGAEAVVHLGNHTTSYGRPARKVFNENVAMNFNVLEAARESGVCRVVFASSVQVIRGERWAREGKPSGLSRLPLDGDMPATPANPYALSKAVGESQLLYAAENFGLTTVALRFPALISDLSRIAMDEPHPDALLDEAFTWLSYRDAARCIRLCLEAPLSGYRCYFPAHPRPWVRQPVEQLRRKYFPDVPVSAPLPLTSFVDGNRLWRELGWSALDDGYGQREPAPSPEVRFN
jgi:UDP-glucose 4-epimerase